MKTKRITAIVLCMVLCIILGGENLLSAIFIPTSAAESEGEIKYTNAYNDLIENRNFIPDEYPNLDKSNPNYYSLEVITIAESVNGELFVYVYQPSANTDLLASHITIARSDLNANVNDLDDESIGKFEVYTLTYINNYNQFFKYKVNNLQVSSDITRYYEITDILRPFNKNFGDKDPAADNTISAVSYAVGKFFTFIGAPGESTLSSAEDIEYITITNKLVGYIRYMQDVPIFSTHKNSTDMHFVAFSTNKEIEKLLEADLYYTQQAVLQQASYYDYRDPVEYYRTLHFGESVTIEVSDGSVFTNAGIKQDRIQKTEDFLNQKDPMYLFPGFSVDQDVEFNEEVLFELYKTQWVLCFAETEYYADSSSGIYTRSFDRIGDVKILRLKFMTDGKIYDLGVVDNMQTGSMDPSAIIEGSEAYQKLEALLIVIIVLLVLYMIIDICVPWLAKIIRWVLGAFWWLFKSLVKLITWPFRALFSSAGRSIKRKLKIKGRRGRPKGRRGRTSKYKPKKETRNQRLMKQTFASAKQKGSEAWGALKAKANESVSNLIKKIKKE